MVINFHANAINESIRLGLAPFHGCGETGACQNVTFAAVDVLNEDSGHAQSNCSTC